MRRFIYNPAVVAGASFALLSPSAFGAPMYTITALSPFGTDTNTGSGSSGISSTGNYATVSTGRTGGYNAIQYNTGTGVSVVQDQTTVTLTNAATGAVSAQPYASPYSVNDAGQIFGTSSSASFRGNSLPTTWQNGVGTALPLPAGGGFTNGQVYGSNDNGQAVGIVGNNVILNTAAVLHHVGDGQFHQRHLRHDLHRG